MITLVALPGRRVWDGGSIPISPEQARRSSGERGAIRRGAAPRGSGCKRSLRKRALPTSLLSDIVLDMFCQCVYVEDTQTERSDRFG